MSHRLLLSVGLVVALSVSSIGLAQKKIEPNSVAKPAKSTSTTRSKALPESLSKGPRKSQIAKLRTVLPVVDLRGTTVKQGMQFLADITGVNLVVKWEKMEELGIDTDMPLDLRLTNVTAVKAMQMVMAQMSEKDDMILEVNQWYVRLMTKEQARANPTVKLYDIRDLLMRIPGFRNAPEFDLTQIASDPSSGGGGSSIFDDSNSDRDMELSKPRSVRGEEIADLIRNTIEPDLWEANGGLGGRVTYWNGYLVVRAPEYVHKQIGIGTPATKSRKKSAYAGRSSYSPRAGYRSSGTSSGRTIRGSIGTRSNLRYNRNTVHKSSSIDYGSKQPAGIDRNSKPAGRR